MENTPQSAIFGIGALVPSLVTIIAVVGLVVLLALHDIDSTAGLTLIGTLAGVHGGAALKG